MEEFLLFLLCYLFIFLLYQILVVRKAKKNKDKEDKKQPVEVLYLERRYRLDLGKVNYNQLLQIVAIVSSFDIALVVSIIMNLNNFWLEIIGGFFSIILTIVFSYHLVYLFYKKKGMINHE